MEKNEIFGKKDLKLYERLFDTTEVAAHPLSVNLFRYIPHIIGDIYIRGAKFLQKFRLL